jgi:hypothetical protein
VSVTSGWLGDDLRGAYGRAESACRRDDDASGAYAKAVELRQGLDVLVGRAAELRAEMAYRVLEDEGMSIAQLAARLGLSKPRAGQLVTIAKQARARRVAGSGRVQSGGRESEEDSPP